MSFTKTREELEAALFKLSAEYSLNSRIYADLQSKFDVLDEQKKSYYTSCVDRYEGSMAEKERKALMDGAYLTWLASYITAKENALKAKVDREIVANKWETCKALLFSKNKERPV